MESNQELSREAAGLLARLKAFCLPGGEECFRAIRGIKTIQRGEMFATANARPARFTAEEFTDATRSAFRWQARFGAVAVTDAYEGGRGRLVVKAGGILPLKRITGPEADIGELQRYLASVFLCPPMLVNHPSLEWTAAGPLILRVRDRAAAAQAVVDIELTEEGRPVACRAERPRLIGKQSVLAPWSVRGSEYREWEGMRVPTRTEAWWEPQEGSFAYFRAEITSYSLLR